MSVLDGNFIVYVCRSEMGAADGRVLQSIINGTFGGERKWATASNFEPGVPAVIWGIARGADKILRLCHKTKTDYYYIDRGFFQRSRTYRIIKNALYPYKLRRRNKSRLQKFGVHQPHDWKHNSNGHIVVCAPSHTFCQVTKPMYGLDDNLWLAHTLKTLKEHTGRKIVVRPKPLGKIISMSGVWQAVKGAHALVTFNSNAAVEAAYFGIPVFTSKYAAATPVASHDLTAIEKPVRPARIPWLQHLTFCQFMWWEFGMEKTWEYVEDVGKNLGQCDDTARVEAELPGAKET